jgi:hypothetical protein
MNNDGLEGLSDREYAGDPDTRICVYTYVLYFYGAPIAWKSNAVNSVALSSTEAEYYATSKKYFLERIYWNPNSVPINIRCENFGAIYLANKHCHSQCTKHKDTSRHFFSNGLKMSFSR